MFLEEFYNRKYRAEAGEADADAGTADSSTGDTGEVTGEVTGEGVTTETAEGTGDGATGDGETKDTGEAEGETTGEAEGETTAKKNAPEKYEEFTVPKEFKYAVTEEAVENFSKIAKDLDLNQEQAQILVDYEIKRQSEMLNQMTEVTEQWSEQSLLDTEIGGADHELKQAKAGKAFDMLATDELKSLMNPYHPEDNPTGQGLGNHPEVVRLFYRIGMKMSEDGLVVDNTTGAQTLAREDVMYGETKE